MFGVDPNQQSTSGYDGFMAFAFYANLAGKNLTTDSLITAMESGKVFGGHLRRCAGVVLEGQPSRRVGGDHRPDQERRRWGDHRPQPVLQVREVKHRDRRLRGWVERLIRRSSKSEGGRPILIFRKVKRWVAQGATHPQNHRDVRLVV